MPAFGFHRFHPKFWTSRKTGSIVVSMVFGKILLLKVLLGFGFGMIILALL
jgi:hypothetical protein